MKIISVLKIIILAGMIVSMVSACLPAEKNPDTTMYSLDDPEIRNIYNAQDERNTAVLMRYLFHDNPGYRFVSALAFGSVQDSTSIDSLGIIAGNDKFENIRFAAAYALGQTNNQAAMPVITKLFQPESSRKVQSALLEATGKCGDASDLKNLSAISTYQAQDSLLLEGLAKGIYRFALRGITIPEGTKKIVDLIQIPGLTKKARIYCSAYLQRAPDISLEGYENALLSVYQKEQNPEVRMFLASALSRTKGNVAREFLIKAFSEENDYRVKCNLLRSLSNYPYLEIRNVPLQAALDSNVHVAVTSAGILKDFGNWADVPLYLQMARNVTDWQVAIPLQAAAIRNTPYRNTLTKDIYSRPLISRVEGSGSDYEKAAALNALAEHVFNYAYIAEKTFGTENPVISSAGMEALVSIRSRPDIDKVFGLRGNYAKRELDAFFVRAIGSGDVALVGMAAGVLRDSALKYNESVKDFEFLKSAQAALSLPKDAETHIELQKTIDFLEGNPANNKWTPEYNHPIDWKALSITPDSSEAEIKTSKGTMVVRLYSKAAPGTVASFSTLVRNGFYNGKFFHRVVPNFVVQGGCPRGDGWGSLDYSIRSEIGPQYYLEQGYLGMASAGKDTEGTQWFITHSPTPHLDGRYTIFGKLIEGKETLHLLQKGDSIESIKIR